MQECILFNDFETKTTKLWFPLSCISFHVEKYTDEDRKSDQDTALVFQSPAYKEYCITGSNGEPEFMFARLVEMYKPRDVTVQQEMEFRKSSNV